MSHFKDTDINLQIMEWDANATELKHLKDLEMKQRKELIATVFADPKIGVNNKELGGGYILKANLGMDTVLDETVFLLIHADLPPEVVDSCVKFKPSLIAAGYKALAGEWRDLMDEAVITKPSSPSLALVAPKPPKKK